MKPRSARRCGPTAAVSIVALSASLLVAGCSGEPENPPSEPAPTGSSGTAVGGSRAPIDVRIATVRGRLDPRAGRRIEAAVGPVVDTWFERAYLGGEYPRATFRDSFTVFTPGAARDARKDIALMSNADVGRKVEAIEPIQRTVRLDVLTAERKPVGATARFWLVFRTSGAYERRVSVTGRLFLLLQRNGRWRVFGYDVAKASR